MTRNLPPLVGGMERLNWHIADELSKYADVRVVGPRGSARFQPKNVKIDEVPLKPLWLFLIAAQLRALLAALKWRPDVVLAGSGLMAPAALLVARATGAQAAVYTHGLDVSASHPIYRAVWRPAIRNIETIIANSKATKALLSEIGVDDSFTHVIHPGVRLPSEPQTPIALQNFREKFNLGSGPILLSIGRLTTRKGLLEFVSHALPAIATVHPDVVLLIVGPAPADALRATEQSRESIQLAAKANDVAKNVVFVGLVSESTLACAFEEASVHVFPIRSLRNDPEGFGMVAIEAAAHGLPTVAFGSGGVVDAVEDGQSGFLVSEGSYDDFSNSVLRVLKDGKAVWKQGSIAFAEKFAWPELGKKMAKALELKVAGSQTKSLGRSREKSQ